MRLGAATQRKANSEGRCAKTGGVGRGGVTVKTLGSRKITDLGSYSGAENTGSPKAFAPSLCGGDASHLPRLRGGRFDLEPGAGRELRGKRHGPSNDAAATCGDLRRHAVCHVVTFRDRSMYSTVPGTVTHSFVGRRHSTSCSPMLSFLHRGPHVRRVLRRSHYVPRWRG